MKDQTVMMMMFLIERSNFDDDDVLMIMFMVEISKYDDDDQKVKVMKMLLLIERSKY